MAFTDIHTMTFAVRSAGDVRGRVEVSLLRKAGIRADALRQTGGATADQRELFVARTILDGAPPVQWVTAVLIFLDASGQLSNPTDAQVNTAVDSAWTYLTASRPSGG